jgi:hypothetical protein
LNLVDMRVSRKLIHMCMTSLAPAVNNSQHTGRLAGVPFAD